MKLHRIYFPISFILLISACASSSRRQATGDHQTDSILHSTAILPFTDSIAEYPRNPRYYFARSSMLYSIRQYTLSKNDLEKAILLDPSEPAYYYGLGEVNMAVHKPAEAKSCFEKALSLNKKNIQVRLELASAMFQLKDYAGALPVLDTILAMDPGAVEANGLKSQIYQELHDTASAILQLKAAIRRSPSNFEALMALGDLLGAQKNPEAISWYQKAFLTDTTRPDALYSEGQFYESVNRNADAINSYRQCIDISRNFLDAYLSLGNIYQRQIQWKKAWEIYNLATKISPTSSEAFYRRGQCNEQLKNREQATEDYEQALALDRNNTRARQALKNLAPGEEQAKKN